MKRLYTVQGVYAGYIHDNGYLYSDKGKDIGYFVDQTLYSINGRALGYLQIDWIYDTNGQVLYRVVKD